jgi:glycosyltransferase involved in cell wall biosynthesis
MPETIVMVATSYPRFPGDTVGTFMEPIAKGIAARGHAVHMVLPWHPRWQRGKREGNVFFHLFHYAPHPSLNVFGYAEALKADVDMRWRAFASAPLALAAGWFKALRVAQKLGATMMHGHWVIPGGVLAAAATPRLPLVISLHGSDVYVAERQPIAGRLAGAAFARAGWVTACSEDLRARAVKLGADETRSGVVPYGVDSERFRPNATARADLRRMLGLSDTTPLVFTAGRFVRKKGFEYLIDAAARLSASVPELVVVLGGDGDLRDELTARARQAGLGERVRFAGLLSQDAVATYLAAADVAVVPSVRDDAGNVDGLPNVVMEALASGTPLVSTPAGGIASVIEHERTGLLVPERDADALARAIARLLDAPAERHALGAAARESVIARFGWERAIDRFEAAYAAAREHRASR